MLDPTEPSRTQTRESPSLWTGKAPTQPPATGLRLPPPRRGATRDHLGPGLSAGGEQLQGTTTAPTQHAAAPRRRTSGSTAEAAGDGPPGAGPTGLVLEGRLATDPDGVGWSLRDDECPLEGALAFDRTTGEVAWRPTCKNARCRRCSRQVSAQTFALARRALDGIDHTRFITLTRAPEGWDQTRQAVKSWLLHLRREGIEMNALWVVEKGEQTGMKHLHAVQWGDYVPKELLEESWPHGSTRIEGARAATDYLGKGVLRYVAKGLDGDGESIESHMNLNGGRAAHWSRGFFAGMSRDGYRKANPLPGIYFVESFIPERAEPPF